MNPEQSAHNNYEISVSISSTVLRRLDILSPCLSSADDPSSLSLSRLLHMAVHFTSSSWIGKINKLQMVQRKTSA